MLKLDKLKLLHAIRGFAAFYVVVYHAKYVLWCGGAEYLRTYPRATWHIGTYLVFALDMLSSAGLQMVIMFFVLSGFFIAYSFEKNRQTPFDFFINRIIRIYVPYLGSVVLGVAVLAFVHIYYPDLLHLHTREFNDRLTLAYENQTWSNFFRSLLFLKNGEYIGCNYAYWSLLYEGMFYLIVPIVILHRRAYFFTAMALFVIGSIRGWSSRYGYISNFVFNLNLYFAAGAFLYDYLPDIKERIQYRPMLRLALMGMILLLSGMMIVLKAAGMKDHLPNVLAGIICILLIILFFCYDFSHNLFISTIKKLGEVSFSLYLIHIPVLIFTYSVLAHITGKTTFYRHIYPAGVVLAVPVSFIFYYLIEQPSTRLIRWVKKKNKNHKLA
ncbi:MAG: acyltransferase [Bacteroidetes bacterium]|nr:acyltransferase [Bacteroidota bacterium]